jgi:hypothetical protein
MKSYKVTLENQGGGVGEKSLLLLPSGLMYSYKYIRIMVGSTQFAGHSLMVMTVVQVTGLAYSQQDNLDRRETL